jgi:hypothetical protein
MKWTNMRKLKVVLAAAVSATAAFAALTIVTAPSASAATAAFSIVSSWGNGYQQQFRVGHLLAGGVRSAVRLGRREFVEHAADELR